MAAESSELKIAVEEPRNWTRRLTITVPAARVEGERQQVARLLGQRLRLPGFRKGKVPAHVIERKYGASIQHETLERVVGEAYREALQRQDLQPISQAEVEDVDYRPGADLTFHVEFEIQPEIELDRLGGFRIERPVPAVGDGDVERVLERLQEEQAVWHPMEEGAPEKGDLAVIELTPAAGPDQERDAAVRRYQVVLGKDDTLPEIEEAILTLEPGQERDITVRLDDIVEEGAPEEQQFQLRLLEAKRPEFPSLDDEFARRMGDFEDLDALRSQVRRDLEREAASDAERELRRQLVDQVLEANPFEVPDSMVDRYLDQLLRPREGADPEQVAEARRQARPAAAQAIRRMLVIDRVAQQEGLRATSADVDLRVETLAQRHDRAPGDIWSQLQKSGRIQALEEEITEEKVFEYLKSQSTIK